MLVKRSVPEKCKFIAKATHKLRNDHSFNKNTHVTTRVFVFISNTKLIFKYLLEYTLGLGVIFIKKKYVKKTSK